MMVRINGTEREYKPGMSVLQLLEETGYSISRVAVEKNGAIVPKGRLADQAGADRAPYAAGPGKAGACQGGNCRPWRPGVECGVFPC